MIKVKFKKGIGVFDLADSFSSPWKSANKSLQKKLNTIRNTPGFRPGYHPDMDFANAQVAIEKLGGGIILNPSKPKKIVKGRIY